MTKVIKNGTIVAADLTCEVGVLMHAVIQTSEVVG